MLFADQAWSTLALAVDGWPEEAFIWRLEMLKRASHVALAAVRRERARAVFAGLIALNYPENFKGNFHGLLVNEI